MRAPFGYLPITSNAVSNAQIVQGFMVHSAFNSSHCPDVLQYVRDALQVSLYLGWRHCFLLRALFQCCTRRQNVFQSRMEKLSLPEQIWQNTTITDNICDTQERNKTKKRSCTKTYSGCIPWSPPPRALRSSFSSISQGRRADLGKASAVGCGSHSVEKTCPCPG